MHERLNNNYSVNKARLTIIKKYKIFILITIFEIDKLIYDNYCRKRWVTVKCQGTFFSLSIFPYIFFPDISGRILPKTK